MPPRFPPIAAGEFKKPAQGPSPRTIAGIVVLLLFFIFVFTSYYTLEPEMVGVIQRFGKMRPELAQPGLHFKLPFGIDVVTKVPVLSQQKIEFGFKTEEAGVTSRIRGAKDDAGLLDQALMLTGDLNMTVVEWVIQYRVSDPKAWLFNLREPLKTLEDATESMMREVVGDHTVDEALTFGRQEIEAAVFTKLQELVKAYAMGISIELVVLQDVAPPAQVEASFTEVNQAQQERESAINKARAEYNKVVPKASGEALQKIQEAEGYGLKRVNEAMGDATRFNSMLTAYLKAPDVTRRRIFLETMAEVIPKLGRKIVLDSDLRQILPLLQLNPTAEAAK